jgi:large subunit ribosomal protein L29
MTKLAEELRDCDDDELETRLGNARKELFNLRFQVATGRLDNVARIGQVRKQVACILTVRRDREITLAESLVDGADVATEPRRVRRARAAGEAAAPSVEGDGPVAVEVAEEEVVGNEADVVAGLSAVPSAESTDGASDGTDAEEEDES